MSCCGDKNVVQISGQDKREGDVLAQTLWGGNHTERGRATGRMYPRSGNGRLMWVDPKDVIQSPHLWRETVQPKVESKPDIPALLLKAKPQRVNDPIFAFGDPFPDSYSDMKRLVELAGYRTCLTSNVDPFDFTPLIVCTPWKPPQGMELLPRRVIYWQLEYAGNYTDNYDGWTGELWASDVRWAREHNAKFVLFGSDGQLAEAIPLEVRYDVTMLGHMTTRRLAIKNFMNDKMPQLRWPENYLTAEQRPQVLASTKIMLQVHQHQAQYLAPQRLALAAAYKMTMASETVELPEDLVGLVHTFAYLDIPAGVSILSSSHSDLNGLDLFRYLCMDHPFGSCVEEALK